jgi:hypothetical protein
MPLIPIDPCYFSSGVAEKKQKKKEVWPIPRLGEKTLTHIKEKQKKKLEGNNVHRIELLPCYYYHFSSVTIQNGPLVDKLKVSGSEYKRRAPENVTKAAGRKKRKKKETRERKGAKITVMVAICC